MVAEIHRRGDGDLSGISTCIDKDDGVLALGCKPWEADGVYAAERQLPASGTTDDMVQPIARCKSWRVACGVHVAARALNYSAVGMRAAPTAEKAVFSLDFTLKFGFYVMIDETTVS